MCNRGRFQVSRLFLPSGQLPFGLDVNTGYELADLKLQWLICDFGRRSGRYREAGLAVEIAQLETQRAYQTVANEVSVAYYQVLRTGPAKDCAGGCPQGGGRLDVARKLAKGGVLEREKVLRAEVQLAESQRQLDATMAAEAIAVAGLNFAIGLNVNCPDRCRRNQRTFHPSRQSLGDCLQTAVGCRREFQVAGRTIEVADEGQTCGQSRLCTADRGRGRPA